MGSPPEPPSCTAPEQGEEAPAASCLHVDRLGKGPPLLAGAVLPWGQVAN